MPERTRDAGDSTIRFTERVRDDAASQIQSVGLPAGALDFTRKNTYPGSNTSRAVDTYQTRELEITHEPER